MLSYNYNPGTFQVYYFDPVTNERFNVCQCLTATDAEKLVRHLMNKEQLLSFAKERIRIARIAGACT